MLTAMAAAGLELAINNALTLAMDQYEDEHAREALKSLDGKVVGIDLQGMNCHFYLIFTANKIHVQSYLQGEADTTIAGSPLSLLRMKLSGNQQQMLFSGDVSIHGDIDLGRQVSALLDGLDIDWEEYLSYLFGDVVAHGLGSRARDLGAWAKQVLTTLSQNSTEYLHEEARLLAPEDEVQFFFTAVDGLRDDVARLEKRFERLQSQLRSKST